MSRVSRREFLSAAGASAAALALGQAVGAQGPVAFGAGPWTYTLVEGWGAPPEGMTFEWGCAVVVDSRDRVYVHSQAKKSVVVYDRDGRILHDWGMNLGKAAHGMYLERRGSDEFLYFSILGPFHQVVKTDLTGSVLLRIGNVSEESSTSIRFPFNMPTDVAVAPNGDIYVCEGYGGNRVHRFTAEGKYVQTIGTPGTGPGQFRTPHGIWVDTRKEPAELYVADRANGRIQVFTLDGHLKREIREGMRNPCCFYQFRDKLFVPDLDRVVTILDLDDRPVAQLGDGRASPSEAAFRAPHALTLDSRGDLYVVEWVPDARLRKFRRTPVAA